MVARDLERVTPSPFQPAWWCRGPHLQTLWPNRLRRPPPLRLARERLELPDGDFLDIDWTADTGDESPIVLLLHGLQGSSRSRYARGLLHAITRRGWRGALMHFRGCSGEPNRLARSYHSGETGDLDYFVGILKARYPRAPLAAIGVSLGGNVLLKWLGEQGARARVTCAVAISVPFVLSEAANRLTRGFSRVYQWSLLRCLRRALDEKRRSVPLPLAVQDLSRLRSFWEFDEHVTAPLHGFRGAHHYYETSSCRPYLARIRVPTLLLQAQDDPFLDPIAIPGPEHLADGVTLELYERGGHVGFVSGTWPWRARYWLEERVPAFLAPHVESRLACRSALRLAGEQQG